MADEYEQRADEVMKWCGAPRFRERLLTALRDATQRGREEERERLREHLRRQANAEQSSAAEWRKEERRPGRPKHESRGAGGRAQLHTHAASVLRSISDALPTAEAPRHD